MIAVEFGSAPGQGLVGMKVTLGELTVEVWMPVQQAECIQDNLNKAITDAYPKEVPAEVDNLLKRLKRS